MVRTSFAPRWKEGFHLRGSCDTTEEGRLGGLLHHMLTIRCAVSTTGSKWQCQQTETGSRNKAVLLLSGLRHFVSGRKWIAQGHICKHFNSGIHHRHLVKARDYSKAFQRQEWGWELADSIFWGSGKSSHYTAPGTEHPVRPAATSLLLPSSLQLKQRSYLPNAP